MRGVVAKQIRKVAEKETIGKPKEVTRKKYRELKKRYKEGK